LKKENPGMTDADAEKLAPTRWKQAEKGVRKEALHWLQHDIGVISFSEINDNILMWSHYAGGHNGICVEFRYTDRDHADFFAKAQRVAYKEKLPIVNFYTASPIKIAKALILTKSVHWSYEREWRMIVPDAAHHSRYIQIPTGVITAVYLGCEINRRNREAISDILQNRNIKVFQAERKRDAYGSNFKPIK